MPKHNPFGKIGDSSPPERTPVEAKLEQEAEEPLDLAFKQAEAIKVTSSSYISYIFIYNLDMNYEL